MLLGIARRRVRRFLLACALRHRGVTRPPPPLAANPVPLARFKHGRARVPAGSGPNGGFQPICSVLCAVFLLSILVLPDLMLVALNLFEALYGIV